MLSIDFRFSSGSHYRFQATALRSILLRLHSRLAFTSANHNNGTDIRYLPAFDLLPFRMTCFAGYSGGFEISVSRQTSAGMRFLAAFWFDTLHGNIVDALQCRDFE